MGFKGINGINGINMIKHKETLPMNKIKTVKTENIVGFKEKEFPDTMYVPVALEGSSNFDAYPDLDGVEHGDVVAIYKLVSVKTVKVKTTVELEEIT